MIHAEKVFYERSISKIEEEKIMFHKVYSKFKAVFVMVSFFVGLTLVYSGFCYAQKNTDSTMLYFNALGTETSNDLRNKASFTPYHFVDAYYNYNSSLSSGYYNSDIFLTIDSAPNPLGYYYWSKYVWFTDGNGAYYGLQTNGLINGQWVGKMVIFSLWNAKDYKAGTKSYCEKFTHEGEGYSCRMKYNWQQGHKYRLRIWYMNDSWWAFYIKDLNTGTEEYLGQIKATTSSLIKNFAVFSEYFMSVNACEEVPYAKVTFSDPTANGGTYKAKFSGQLLHKTCKNVKVVASDNKLIAETGGKMSVKTLTSLSISGPASVNENASASYTATAWFSDGTSQNITSSGTWIENSSYTYFDSYTKGKLITNSVTSNQSVTLTATYVYGGVTKSGTKTITVKDSVTKPSAPSNLKATALSSSSIKITWTDSSNNETGFNVWRWTTQWTLIGKVTANTTNYTDNGLTSKTTYYYIVQSYNSAGSTDAANYVNATSW